MELNKQQNTLKSLLLFLTEDELLKLSSLAGSKNLAYYIMDFYHKDLYPNVFRADVGLCNTYMNSKDSTNIVLILESVVKEELLKHAKNRLKTFSSMIAEDIIKN